MSETVEIKYKIGEEDHVFVLDSRKSWKGKLIRGHDVAEMIADDIWSKSAMMGFNKYPTTIHITAPAAFAGVYEIQAKFEPTFSAKRVDNAA